MLKRIVIKKENTHKFTKVKLIKKCAEKKTCEENNICLQYQNSQQEHKQIYMKIKKKTNKNNHMQKTFQ